MPTKKHFLNDLVASDAEADITVQTKEILGKLAGRSYEWLLVTKQHIFPCEAHIHPTRDSLIGDLGGALTCSCDVVAVFHQGRELSEAEVGPLRTEALEGLEPISRARVDGRF